MAVKVKVVVVCKSFFFRDDKISDKFALVDRVGEQHRQQRDAQPAGREPQLRQPCLGYIEERIHFAMSSTMCKIWIINILLTLSLTFSQLSQMLVGMEEGRIPD